MSKLLLRLGFLSDSEYEEAERLARHSDIPLDKCPTCHHRRIESIVGWVPEDSSKRRYRLHGEWHPCDCATQIALRTRYLIANIGAQYMRLDWADYDGSDHVRENVKFYLDKWESFKRHGMGVEFGGKGLGVGKTFGATHIGKELIKRGQKVYFLPFVEMVSAFEKQDGEEIERRMRETTYLILDDVWEASSGRQASFYAVRLEALIRHRTNHNLPTIITTNLTEEELNYHYPRTYSLLAAKQIRIDLTGADARQGKIAKENLEFVVNDEIRPIN